MMKMIINASESVHNKSAKKEDLDADQHKAYLYSVKKSSDPTSQFAHFNKSQL